MLPEIGLFLLCLAFSLSTAGIVGIYAFYPVYPEKALASLVTNAWLIIGLCSVSCFIFVYSYCICDFSLESVVFNCCQEQSLFYRIAAVRSNQEGSMMLWLFLLQITLGLLALQKTTDLPFRFWAIFVQIILISLFLGFILIDCHPFKRFFPPPLKGLGLNPALHDSSLGIHPPTLYSSLVGYSGLFSLTIAGAITRRLGSANWAAFAQPWALNLWCLQTAGITFGSWWAYYELGWGGWWAWDPVENVSLLPWLINLATIHCLKPRFLTIISSKIFLWLGAGPFLCAVFGTLLVRSGAISSVHAFVADANRGLLLSLVFLSLLAAVLYISWVYVKKSQKQFRWHPMRVQLIFLTGCCVSLIISFIILLGSPLLDIPFSLNSMYFKLTFLPCLIGLVVFMPWGYMTTMYKKAPLHLRKKIAVLGCLSLSLIVFFLSSLPDSFGLDLDFGIGKAIGFGAAFWSITTTVVFLCDTYKNIDISKIAGLLSHLGIGVFLFGATTQTFYSFSESVILPPGGSATVGAFTIALKQIRNEDYAFLTINQALLDIIYQGKNLQLAVENHFFPIQQRLQHKTTIHPLGMSDLYIVVGQKIEHNTSAEKYLFNIYKNVGVRFIWLGSALMIIGAFLSNRLRRKKQ